MEGILIGTAILWGVNALLIMPVVGLLLNRRIKAEGIGSDALAELPADQQQHWRRNATLYHVVVSVVVLGIVGFVAGLMGFYFIGISLEAKSWPGMIAFIAASFAGVALTGTAAL